MTLTRPTIETAIRHKMDMVPVYGGLDKTPHTVVILGNLLTDYENEVRKIEREGYRLDANGHVVWADV